MNYQRVIPRDLFNEANLLKCHGQLYLKIEFAHPDVAVLDHYGNAFVIEQDKDDGSLSIFNVQLRIRGGVYHLFRPLNSREAWPLYARAANSNEYPVFDEQGELSQEFQRLLGL